MKCEYCENEVPAGVSRCPSCGAAVKLSVDVVAVAQPKVCEAPTRIPASPECEEAPQPCKRKMKAVYVVLGFFLISKASFAPLGKVTVSKDMAKAARDRWNKEKLDKAFAK